MLVKILGGIDLIIGLILVFGAGIKLPVILLFVLGAILLLKSFLGFLRDWASWIDFISAAFLFLSSILLMPSFISVILGILIIQKGVFSFL